MKTIHLVLIILVFYYSAFAQKSDLIVTTKGDSIACKIETVTDSVIYFRMITNNKWVKSNYNTNQIAEYKLNQFKRNQFEFEEGTSVISSLKKPTEFTSFYDNHRNTLTLESNIGFNSLNYCRLFPMKSHNHLSVGTGINYFAFGAWWVSAESTILIGKTRHFFEAGVEVALHYPIEDIPGFTIIGYRFQGYNGLILKANLHLIFPMVSIGYSF